MTLIDELVAKHGTKNTLVGEVFNDALRSALEEMLERCAEVAEVTLESIGEYETTADATAAAIRALAKEGK